MSICNDLWDSKLSVKLIICDNIYISDIYMYIALKLKKVIGFEYFFAISLQFGTHNTQKNVGEVNI